MQNLIKERHPNFPKICNAEPNIKCGTCLSSFYGQRSFTDCWLTLTRETCCQKAEFTVGTCAILDISTYIII